MIEKLHINEVKIYETRKDGTELSFTDKKTGEKRKYKSAQLKTEERGTVYLGVFDPKQQQEVLSWTPEMEVELDIKVNGDFTNASFPTKDAVRGSEIEKLTVAVQEIVKRLRALEDWTGIQK